MNKRTENNALKTINRSGKNSIFDEIKIKFDFYPIYKPQEPHKKKGQSYY